MTGAELERVDGAGAARGWLEVWGPSIELAKAIAGTDFVPRAMRNNPAAISAAILYGDEVGIGPMQSLARISVIEGRPTLAAETQRGLVLAAGHELWLDELTPTRATWCGKRAGSEAVTRITWTMDDARRAGLDRKVNWRTYPRAMLSARASAELVRAVFADVIGGLAATEEILDADELEAARESGTVALPAGTAASGKRRRRRPAVTAAVEAPAREMESAPAADLPPLPDELEAGSDGAATDAPPAVRGDPQVPPAAVADPHAAPSAGSDDDAAGNITGPQRRRMMALFRRRKMDDRRERLRYASGLVGRTLKSSNDLTVAEADRVIDELEAAASRAPVDDDEAPDDEAPPE